MKRTFKMALIASLAVGGSYVLYGSQNKEELSDLALSNVEALTLGTKDCMYQRNSRCYELIGHNFFIIIRAIDRFGGNR